LKKTKPRSARRTAQNKRSVRDRRSRTSRLDPYADAPALPYGELTYNDSWAAGKQIDRIPGEWTYPLWPLRAVRFHSPQRRVYERLTSHAEVSHWLGLNYRLGECRLSPVPVTAVLAIFESCFDTTDGVLPLPHPEDRFLGHHQVQLATYYSGDQDTFGFANSWGLQWGDEGYGSVGRDYFEQYCTESWAQRCCGYGLNVSPDFEPFDPALTCEQLVREWQRPPSGATVMLPRKRPLYWYRATRMYRNGYTMIGEIADARGVNARLVSSRYWHSRGPFDCYCQ
jgi:hypothetical protein